MQRSSDPQGLNALSSDPSRISGHASSSRDSFLLFPPPPELLQIVSTRPRDARLCNDKGIPLSPCVRSANVSTSLLVVTHSLSRSLHPARFSRQLSPPLSYQHLEDTTVIRPITLELATRVTEFLVPDATCRYRRDVTAAPTSLEESSGQLSAGSVEPPIQSPAQCYVTRKKAGTLEFPSFSRAYRRGESVRPSRYQEEARLSTLSNIPGILASSARSKEPLFAQLAPRRGGRLCRRISGRRGGGGGNFFRGTFSAVKRQRACPRSGNGRQGSRAFQKCGDRRLRAGLK